MNISRRSFLKLAALSTAAVAVSASTDHKIWENGKKTVQSKDQFFLDLLKDLKNWSDNGEVAKKITAELAKDYTMTGKKVTITDSKPDSSATAHTITFIFKVENA